MADIEITDIIREALALRQEAEGAHHSAKLYREGAWDENSAFLFAKDILACAYPIIAKAAKAEAREACAKLAREIGDQMSVNDEPCGRAGDAIAAAIRSMEVE